METVDEIKKLEKEKEQLEKRFSSKIHDGRTSIGKFYQKTLELLDLKIKRLEYEELTGTKLISVDEAIELQNIFKELVRG